MAISFALFRNANFSIFLLNIFFIRYKRTFKYLRRDLHRFKDVARINEYKDTRNEDKNTNRFKIVIKSRFLLANVQSDNYSLVTSRLIAPSKSYIYIYIYLSRQTLHINDVKNFARNTQSVRETLFQQNRSARNNIRRACSHRRIFHFTGICLSTKFHRARHGHFFLSRSGSWRQKRDEFPKVLSIFFRACSPSVRIFPAAGGSISRWSSCRGSAEVWHPNDQNA